MEKESSKEGTGKTESEADGQRRWHHARGNTTAAEQRETNTKRREKKGKKRQSEWYGQERATADSMWSSPRLSVHERGMKGENKR